MLSILLAIYSVMSHYFCALYHFALYIPLHYGMKHRIVWPGNGAYGTENVLLLKEGLWTGLYNLGCEVNKKGIYIA